jgi:hypothetical protein
MGFLLPEIYHPLNQLLMLTLSHAWRQSGGSAFVMATAINKKPASGGSISVG